MHEGPGPHVAIRPRERRAVEVAGTAGEGEGTIDDPRRGLDHERLGSLALREDGDDLVVGAVAPRRPGATRVASAPGELPEAFRGNGMWIWQLSRTEGGDLDRIAARAKAAGRARFVVGDAAAPPLAPGAYDVVLSRHVLWALDAEAALPRWVGLLAEGGRLVLVEGRWHTGAGLTAAQTEALLRAQGLAPTTYPLTEDAYWGGPITDERYLILA